MRKRNMQTVLDDGKVQIIANQQLMDSGIPEKLNSKQIVGQFKGAVIKATKAAVVGRKRKMQKRWFDEREKKLVTVTKAR